MYLLGRFLGWIIVAGYTLTVLNYFVKLINRQIVAKMPQNSPARQSYTVFLRFIIKHHRDFAIVTAVVLLTHFIIQYLSWGFYTTGLIAGGLLIVQGSLGAFGTYVKKKKSGPWLYAHRTIAVLLLAGIVLHVLTVALHLRIG